MPRSGSFCAKIGSVCGVRMKAEGLFELASFLETLPEPHILCSRDYRIVAANAAYRGKCAHFAQVLGKTCYRGVAPLHRALRSGGEACPLARSLASGQRERAVHLHYCSGGELYESIDLSPVRNREGEITHSSKSWRRCTPPRAWRMRKGSWALARFPEDA